MAGRSRQRIGTGYDIHRFGLSGQLKLGGLEVGKGPALEGHSDGDVVLHAVCDALLGAAGLGDIGEHFPDTDERLKDADSALFLDKVSRMLAESGYAVVNLDLTLVIERPVMSPFRGRMTARIAQLVGVDPSRVNVKFKTSEGMGSVGRSEAAVCHAAACIESRDQQGGGSKCSLSGR